MSSLHELAQPALTLLKENEGFSLAIILVAFLFTASTFLRIGIAKGKTGHVRRGFGISDHPIRITLISGLLVLGLGYAAIFSSVHDHLKDCVNYKVQRIEQAHGAVSVC